MSKDKEEKWLDESMVNVVDEENPESEELTFESVNPTDVEWTDYVIKHMCDEELVDGNPTVDGLRRVTEKFIGPIMASETEVLQCPEPHNENRATVRCRVRILDIANNLDMVYDGCADVHKSNTAKYFEHPVAMAETRAEGRALRRALKLRKLIAAEESKDFEEPKVSSPEDNKVINANQETFLSILCEKHNINIEKLVHLMFKGSKKSIKDIKNAEVQAIGKKLNGYQQGVEDIPDGIIGYDASWQENFGKS